MALDPIKQMHIIMICADPDEWIRTTTRKLINEKEMFLTDELGFELRGLSARCRACSIRGLLSVGIRRTAIRLLFWKKRTAQ